MDMEQKWPHKARQERMGGKGTEEGNYDHMQEEGLLHMAPLEQHWMEGTEKGNY